MNNLAKLILNDFDQIRKELQREVLTYPADSPDDRYVAFFDYIKLMEIPVEVIHNFDWDNLGEEDDTLSQITQCRDGNVNQDKVEDYKVRFENGEKLHNPIVAIYHEGKYYIVFGNQRSKGMRLAGETTSIICLGKGMPYDDKKTIGLRLANISNRKTKLDVDTDSNEEIHYQMQNEWNRVLEINLSSNSLISEPYVKANKEYHQILVSKGMDAADDYKRKHFMNWFAEVKPDTLSKKPKTKKAQFGQYYSEAFNKNIKQRLTPGFHCGKEQEIYNSFWSMIEIDDDGLEQEMYIWDTKTYSFANDTETVQMDARNGNPKQNTTTSIFSNKYSGKRCKSVEVMLRPPQNMRDINTIIGWEADCRTKFKEYNTNPNHSLWSLPTIDKLIFLKHAASDHETTAWEWKKTPSGGFFKQII